MSSRRSPLIRTAIVLVVVLVAGLLWWLIRASPTVPVVSEAPVEVPAPTQAPADSRATVARQATPSERTDPVIVDAEPSTEIDVEPPPKPVMSMGSLSRDEIDQVVRLALPYVKDCYEDLLEDNNAAEGRIAVKFVIEPGEDGVGELAKLDIKASDFDDYLFEECVLTEMASLEYPNPQGGMVIVSYPFSFSPGSPDAPAE